MRKLFTVLTVGFLVSLFSFAAVTIDYMTFSAVPSHEETLQEIVNAFEKENPDIRINVIPVAWEDYFLKLSTMYAGNTQPDTFEINYENFVEYAADGLLSPIDDINKKMNFSSEKIFYDKAYRGFSSDGKQYGFPASFSTVVLFYNKDLFDAAGVEYPKSDWSWIDEFEAAKLLTDEDQMIWGTYQPIQFWEYYKVLAQNSGSMIKDGKATINSTAGVNALKWLVDKIKYNIMPSTEEEAGLNSEDLFVNGQLAMVHTGIWFFSQFREECDFDWDIQVEPGMASKGAHYFANAVVMSNRTNNRDAAWKWMKFLTTSELAAKLRFEKGWELPAISDEALLKPYLNDNSLPLNKKAIFESLEGAAVPPVIRGWGAFTDVVNKELDSVKLGLKSAQAALDVVAEEINKQLK